MQLVQDDLEIQIMHVTICLIIFGAHMKSLSIIKVKILLIIKWSYRSPLIMSTIVPQMISVF